MSDDNNLPELVEELNKPPIEPTQIEAGDSDDQIVIASDGTPVTLGEDGQDVTTK